MLSDPATYVTGRVLMQVIGDGMTRTSETQLTGFDVKHAHANFLSGQAPLEAVPTRGGWAGWHCFDRPANRLAVRIPDEVRGR